MEDLWLGFQPGGNTINLELLASLQSEGYMQLNVDWNEIQN
jgi:hypothetical protein